MLKKVGAAFLAGLFFVNIFICSSVFADAIDDTKAQKKEIDRQVQQAKQRHKEAQRKTQRAAGDLENVVQKLGKLQRRSKDLQKREGQLHVSLQNNSNVLASKKQELVERQQIYSQRLRNIYICGQIGYLDVFLGAQDFGDFVGRAYLFDKVVNRDMDMLKEIENTVKEINERSARQERELVEIAGTQRQIAKDKVDMAELREKRQKLLAAAENEESREKSEYDKLMESSEKVTAMLKAMEKANPQRFPDKADNFIWPACGIITSYAGWRVHPVFGTRKYHSGMDIGIDYYTPIKAANRGTVTYAGWMDGYGYTVMIDHGDGLVTLYAHCSSVKCNEGQFVKQGEVVASSGATGWATGPHLHFEVRLHGEVVDPLNYISEKDNIY